jgi:hypothetical protein
LRRRLTLATDDSIFLGMKSCAWCRQPLEVTDVRRKHCKGQKCRQAAYRLRKRLGEQERNDKPMRFAYADPPYPGRAAKYYGDQPSFGGEVDHVALIASLEASGYDGWALSTAADALRDILPLCPATARVCPWVKPGSAPPATKGIHNMWEPLIVVGGRQEPPGKCDWLRAQPARFGGDLPGRKPLAFIAFLWRMLGARPGDSLDDLFPGTGIVGRAWENMSRAALGDVQPQYLDDVSVDGLGDVLSGAGDDGFGDASFAAATNMCLVGPDDRLLSAPDDA